MWKRAGIATLGTVVLCLGLSIAAAQQTGGEMPAAAETYLGKLTEYGRADGETPADVRTTVSYDGEDKVNGRRCYLFTVYAALPDRYERLGSYAVGKDGKDYYRLDVVTDEYHPMQRP